MQIGSSGNPLTSTVMNQHKTTTQESLANIAAARELGGKDGSNLITANMLNAQLATMTQQVQNENSTIGMLQIADGALKGVQAGAERLGALSAAYNNATLGGDQRAILEQEFNATRDAMSDMIGQTTFNGKPLFGSTSALGLGEINMGEVSLDNQDSIQALQDQVGGLFSEVGSASQGAQVAVNNLLAGISSTTSSYAQTSETPLGQKLNELSQSQTGLTASTLAQSHNMAILQQQMATLLK